MRTLLCAVLGWALVAGGLDAQDRRARDARTGKDKRTTTSNEMLGKVRSVDRDAGTLTVTTADGRTHTYRVTKKTRVVGPRGGVSKRGLGDDRLNRGAEVAVILITDGKTATVVRLATRRGTTVRDKRVRDRKVTDREIRDRGVRDRAVRDRTTTDKVRDRAIRDNRREKDRRVVDKTIKDR